MVFFSATDREEGAAGTTGTGKFSSALGAVGGADSTGSPGVRDSDTELLGKTGINAPSSGATDFAAACLNPPEPAGVDSDETGWSFEDKDSERADSRGAAADAASFDRA